MSNVVGYDNQTVHVSVTLGSGEITLKWNWVTMIRTSETMLSY